MSTLMLGQSIPLNELLQLGLSRSQAGEGAEALALFHQAATAAPESGAPHFLIGAELMQAGRVHEAEAAYANAVLLDPGLGMARFQLGLLQFTSGRVALGLLTWEPLLSCSHEEDALRHAVRGFAALAKNDLTSAIASFRQAQALATANPPLSRDLQMMIDRITSQLPSPSALGLPSDGAASSAQDTAGGKEGLHILLANYQRQGPAH